MPGPFSTTGQWHERLKAFFEEKSTPDGLLELNGFSPDELEIEIQTGNSSRDVNRAYIEHLSNNRTLHSMFECLHIQEPSSSSLSIPPWNAQNIPTGPDDIPYDTIILNSTLHGKFLVFIVGEAIAENLSHFDLNVCLMRKWEDTWGTLHPDVPQYGAVLNGDMVTFFVMLSKGVPSSLAFLQAEEEQFLFHQSGDEVNGGGLLPVGGDGVGDGVTGEASAENIHLPLECPPGGRNGIVRHANPADNVLGGGGGGDGGSGADNTEGTDTTESANVASGVDATDDAIRDAPDGATRSAVNGASRVHTNPDYDADEDETSRYRIYIDSSKTRDKGLRSTRGNSGSDIRNPDWMTRTGKLVTQTVAAYVGRRRLGKSPLKGRASRTYQIPVAEQPESY
ncbi:hypothetical protein ASPCADRAFT_409848 [Aspergillus carbonarius ITEM 5010]|uniref:Uncharacterized protein n=1 Tax=Aspergillus carbonarius (strain ITEM 5010) TaxID=602072 RepID=A0A1R3R8R9_ASPC5|nr:hypothetical protein ASPCADRAFT_409848 [Aspergillus carbonarius ITEM 5010]